MKKLLLLTGGLAAGKSTFSRILSTRYGTAAFQKDTVKELLCDHIGFRNREENKAISNAAVDAMCHIFSRISLTGASLILEANFHEDELEKLHSIARESQYDVLTLVLHGDAEVLYRRYLHRMREESRHPAHSSLSLEEKANFIKMAELIQQEQIPGKTLVIEATEFSYQDDPAILAQIDHFMND